MNVNSTEVSNETLKTATSVRLYLFAFLINPCYLLGIFGNLVIILVFRRLKRRFGHSNGHFYLIWLAVFELAYCISMFEYTAFAWNIPQLETVSSFLCAFTFFIRGIFGIGANIIFVAFSVDRYLAITSVLHAIRGVNVSKHSASYCPPISQAKFNHSTSNHGGSANNPDTETLCGRRQEVTLVSKKQSPTFHCFKVMWRPIKSRFHWLGLAACTVIGCLASAPRLTAFALATQHHHVSCIAQELTKSSTILHMIVHLVVQRVGPGIINTLCNLALYFKMKEINQLSQIPKGKKTRTEMKLVKACIILGIVYMLLSMPPGIYWTIIYTWIIQRSQPISSIQYHAIMGDMLSIVASLNNTVNCLVYLNVLDYFSRECKDLFRCKSTKTPTADDSSLTDMVAMTTVAPIEEY